MPPRNVPAKDRAWGSRYDSLDSSSISPLPLPSSSSSVPSNSPASVSPSRLTTNNSAAALPTATSTSSPPGKSAHDASIFVGSLPSHIDHSELTRLLSEHLSEHVEVKSVKVIRDNKGGVCAFVQCENATAALKLIQVLQSQPPRPFIGRYLRFEPARASRALLVSYRAPTRPLRGRVAFDSFSPNTGSNSGYVYLELATALRILRPRHSRYLTILYNDEARNFSIPTPDYDIERSNDDLFAHEGFYLDPLRYDDESLRSLAAAFGPIENFAEASKNPGGKYSSPLPRPDHAFFTRVSLPSAEVQNGGLFINSDCLNSHSVPRASGMDPRIWEIRWKNREDCVTALMILRRIPHFTVTWAHHESSPTSSTSASSGLQSSSPSARSMAHPDSPSPSRTFRERPQLRHPTSPIYQHAIGRRRSTSQENGFSTTPALLMSASPTARAEAPLPQSSIAPYTCLDPPNSPPVKNVGEVDRLPDLHWGNSDFPPLRTLLGQSYGTAREPPFGTISTSESHSGATDEPPDSPSPSSSLSVQPATPIPPSMVDPTEREELLAPSVQEFTKLNLTNVTPETARLPPFTPQSVHDGIERTNAECRPDENLAITPMRVSQLEETTRDMFHPIPNRQFDPFTIFVGGLELFGLNAWDEAKLRSVFVNYGEIENVQIVRPVGKKTGFAFVRFKNKNTGACAVAGEHNRVYNGNPIRVQLRETTYYNISPWRHGRSKGKIPDNSMSLERGGSCPANTTGSIANGHSPTGSSRILATPEPSSTDLLRMSAQAPTPDPISGPPSFAALVPAGMSQIPPAHLAHTPREANNPACSGSVGTTSSLSPSPPTLGHPPMGPIAQYHLPISTCYYSNQQWVHPYSSYPYGMPFIPGYMAFSHPLQGPASEFGTPGVPTFWPDAYKGTATPDQPQPQIYPQHNTQPPLRPTGFIQGEQGTLIPVYQPDALDRYMSSASSGRIGTPPAQPPTQLAAGWPQYTPMTIYPYTHHPAHAIPSAPQLPPAGQNSGWLSAGQAQTQYLPTAQAYVPFVQPITPQRGVGIPQYSALPGGRHSPTARASFGQISTPRRYQRRDWQTNKHNTPRTSPARFARVESMAMGTVADGQ